MEAKVTWKGEMSFEGTADSGFTIPLDAKPSAGGQGAGFIPIELLAVGLAGCTSMDVISIMKKKRQDVTDFEVQVHAQRAEEHPRVITSAVIEYIVSGHGVDEAALVRSIELSATRYCPSQAMFEDVFPMELKYSIYEDLGDGQRELVTEGVYSQPAKQV